MGWLTIAIVLAVVGLVVVGVCTARAAFALRTLSREIRRIRTSLEPIRAEPANELQKTGTAAR